MQAAIDTVIVVGLEEGIWTISAQSKSNPLDVWAKKYADKESAQNEAYGLGLIDKMSELREGGHAIGNWYHRTGQATVSAHELERQGFERRVVQFNYRVVEGHANIGGMLRTQHRVSLPNLGELIGRDETGRANDYKVKSIMGPHILGGKVTYTMELE